MRKLAWLAVAAIAVIRRRHGERAADAAQGRHAADDGTLCGKLRQPRSARDAAGPGRHRRQGAAALALQLGHRRQQTDSGARQVGRGVGRRPHLHLQAARRRLLPQRPQDDGRRRDLLLHAHHGRQQGLSRCALRPPDQGCGRCREGHGQGNRRPEEDRRLHARDDDHRPCRPRLLLLRRLDRDPAQGRGRERQLCLQSGRPGSVQVQGAHPGLARRDGALRQVLQDRPALSRQARGADHGRGRRPRRGLPQQGDRHVDPGTGAVRRLSRRSAALQGHPGSGRDVHRARCT